MRERPILFSGPMVRAILDGKKHQTRRVLPMVFNSPPGLVTTWHPPGTWQHLSPAPAPPAAWGAGWRSTYPSAQVCPYGVPGDRLWVRETHALIAHDGFTWVVTSEGNRVLFHADLPQHPETYPDGAALPDPYGSSPRWRPSIHMPRWASRLTLEVTGIRVERLNDISEADARAEGVQSDTEALSALSHLRGADAARAVPSRLRSARDSFRDLWDGINGKRAPWASSPWVWVVEFKRLPDAGR